MIEYLAEKRAFRERLAQRDPRHPHLPLIDADIAQTEAKVTLFPQQEPQESRPVELDLEAEWEEQSARLAERYAPELSKVTGKHISQEEYRKRYCPAILPQPDGYKELGLNNPLLVPVHPELGIDRTARIAGIIPYYDADATRDWKDRRHGFTTPQVSYTTWVDYGSRSLNMSVDDVRRGLAADARGGNVHDGIASYLKNPDILKQHFLDLPGSQVGSVLAPYLRVWFGRPELRLHVYWAGLASPGFGSVRAGRQINTQ